MSKMVGNDYGKTQGEGRINKSERRKRRRGPQRTVGGGSGRLGEKKRGMARSFSSGKRGDGDTGPKREAQTWSKGNMAVRRPVPHEEDSNGV